MSLASRFFARGSSESETESEEEKIKEVPHKPTYVFSDDSDDDRDRQHFRSGAEKKKEEYFLTVKRLRNSIKIKDFDQILTEFSQLHKVILKHKASYFPNFVVKALYEVDEQSRIIWDDKEQKSKFSKLKLKSLTTLRQKIKKMNKDYEEDIEKCRNNPDLYESEPEIEDVASSESGSESDLENFVTKAPRVGGAQDFMKTDKTKEIAKKRERKTKDVKKKSEDLEKIEISLPSIRKSAKELIKLNEITSNESALQAIRDLQKLRGKKISDRSILSSYIEIKKITESKNLLPSLTIKCLLMIVTIQCDFMQQDRYTNFDMLKLLFNNYHTLLNMINSFGDLVVRDDINDENEKLFEKPYFLMGNIIHPIFRIYDELNKILLNTDHHSLEYLSKMKDLSIFLDLVISLQKYVEKNCSPRVICDVYLLRIEQIYYKLDQQWLIQLHQQISNDASVKNISFNNKSISDESLISKLANYIVKNGKERGPLRAILYQVYHHAIHNRWHKAHQLFLMSRIQESIQNSDIPNQILFNRVTVQLGLCAFRNGHFNECLNALREIQSSGRIKELLAQGFHYRTNERNSKQEMIDRRHLLPFHMHINLELVECAYLISILLIEAVYSCAPIIASRELFCSRSLVLLVKNYERFVILGPPENLREYIYAAFKSLKIGDWGKAFAYIKSISCWKLLTNSDVTLQNILFKLKCQSLIAFLFSNCYCYESIRLDYLVEQFQLDKNDIVSSINSIILNKHLPAKWNQESTVLFIDQNRLPRDLHYLCQDSINVMTEFYDINKRVIDAIKDVESACESLVITNN